MSDRRVVDYDVVVVGGGHNGLVCAAYLVRAGMSVCVIEARSEVGGCAGSDSVFGSRVNICNCDHSLLRTLPLIDELQLGDHGLRYIDLDPGQVALGWDAPGPVPLFRDVERTLDGLAVHFPGEVAGYRRYAADAIPMASLVLELASQVPSPGAMARRALGRSRAAARLLRWSRRSVGDVLDSYFDHDGLLGPAMAGGPAVWGLRSTTPGTGLGALAYALKHVAPVGRPVGGSGILTDALASRVLAGGGAIRTSSRVTGILCEDGVDGGGVRAVTMRRTAAAEGDEAEDQADEAEDQADEEVSITTSSVVVACDPRRAFVEYLRNPPPEASALIDRWRDRKPSGGYESKIDALVERLPRWKHSADTRLARRVGFEDHLSPSTVVAPGLADIDQAHDYMGRGWIAERPMLFINIPSVLDPSVAPAGKHLLSIEVLFTPYHLGGSWADPAGTRSERGRWLEVASTLFEPGFLDSVEQWRAVTPIDYERDFNMPKGHAASYAGGPVAALLGHDPELSRYETPIPGLYLTGAATFPGAGVWGAAGRNTAATVLDNR